jgi:uncharacterized protein HemY
MIVIALILLALAIALIVAAVLGQSANVTVDFFDVSIATDTSTVFLAGVLTGMIALLAFVLLRVALRRSRQRRAEVRELRRRAQTAPAATEDDKAVRQYADDEVDDATMTDSPDYPTEERRT